MSKKNNIIEINGRAYDARTGALHTATVPVSSEPNIGQTMDGVLSHAAAPAPVVAPSKQPVVLSSTVTTPVMDIARAPASHSLGRKQQQATTLMRSAVTKPAPGLKRTSQTIAPLSSVGTVSTISQASIQKDAHTMKREERAKTTPKSTAVARFSSRRQVYEPIVIEPSATRPSESAGTAAVAAAQPAEQPSLTMFEKALRDAPITSPTLLPKTPRFRLSRKVSSAISISAAVVIVGGFLIYQNVSNIHLYMASNAAGFQASLPGYHPSGFGLGTVTASTGDVATTFTSNSDGRRYTLTQKPSDWDSATLLESYVQSASNDHFQTILSAGRTIYVYGDDNATWVNGGIWYQLTSQGALSNQQLIQIATSI